MSTQFTTEGVGRYADEVRGLKHSEAARHFLEAEVRKGRYWSHRAGFTRVSDDFSFLAYQCWRGMSVLRHQGEMTDDYIVAGDVLDDYVSDRDAELLVEVVPGINAEAPIGGMTAAATGVHTALLTVVSAMREAWTKEEADVRHS